MALLAAPDALERVRRAHADLVAAELAELVAIYDARKTPGVTMEQIAGELGMTRDGLYKMLRTKGVRDPRA